MILAVLLAAGRGSRWTNAGGAGHKLLALMADGRTVFETALAAVPPDVSLAVVTGAADLAPYIPASVIQLHNENWATGQASSVRVATAYAEQMGHTAIVVGLGDQPWITSHSWQVVIDRLKTPGRPILIPTINGVRGQPVGLRSSHWGELPAMGDEGARALARQEPMLVEEVVCLGDTRSLIDIDRPSDLSP